MRSILSFIYRQGLTVKKGASAAAKIRPNAPEFSDNNTLHCGSILQNGNWGRPMWMPFSHELPTCLARDRHTTRSLNGLPTIFVLREGLFVASTSVPILAIQLPLRSRTGQIGFWVSSRTIFFRCLTRNFADVLNVHVLKTLCSTADGLATYNVTTTRGTARFDSLSLGSCLFKQTSLIPSSHNFRNSADATSSKLTQTATILKS